VLVTQAFHLPRALFTCGQLGLQVTGAMADLRYYGRPSMTWSTVREIPASLLALYDVVVARPPAIMDEGRRPDMGPGTGVAAG
jgi:vancomycin permeability regulator SanA